MFLFNPRQPVSPVSEVCSTVHCHYRYMFWLTCFSLTTALTMFSMSQYDSSLVVKDSIFIFQPLHIQVQLLASCSHTCTNQWRWEVNRHTTQCTGILYFVLGPAASAGVWLRRIGDQHFSMDFVAWKELFTTDCTEQFWSVLLSAVTSRSSACYSSHM